MDGTLYKEDNTNSSIRNSHVAKINNLENRIAIAYKAEVSFMMKEGYFIGGIP